MTKGQASPTTEPDWERGKLTPHGTRINPFYPLVVALASGANFIARASSSDPNGTAKVIAEAVRHPGFSFVQVMSPCITFRPEQREWKKMVRPAPMQATSNPAKAARRLMDDDSFFLGTLFKGERAAFRTEFGAPSGSVHELEADFRISS